MDEPVAGPPPRAPPKKNEAQRAAFERCGGVPSTAALRFECNPSKGEATRMGGENLNETEIVCFLDYA
jgi:hypothetical protein